MAKLKLELTASEIIALVESIDSLESIMMEDEDTINDIKKIDKMLKRHGIDRKKFAKSSDPNISIEDIY